MYGSVKSNSDIGILTVITVCIEYEKMIFFAVLNIFK